MKKVLSFILCASMIFSLTACSFFNSSNEDNPSSSMSIVTTNYITYSLTKDIVKDLANVYLVEKNPDEDLDAKDLKNLRESKIVIYQGDSIDPWVNNILSEDLADLNIKTINAAKGVTFLDKSQDKNIYNNVSEETSESSETQSSETESTETDSSETEDTSDSQTGNLQSSVFGNKDSETQSQEVQTSETTSSETPSSETQTQETSSSGNTNITLTKIPDENVEQKMLVEAKAKELTEYLNTLSPNDTISSSEKMGSILKKMRDLEQVNEYQYLINNILYKFAFSTNSNNFIFISKETVSDTTIPSLQARYLQSIENENKEQLDALNKYDVIYSGKEIYSDIQTIETFTEKEEFKYTIGTTTYTIGYSKNNGTFFLIDAKSINAYTVSDKDEFYWLSIPNVKLMAENIKEGLSLLSENNSSAISKNYSELITNLESLESKYEALDNSKTLVIGCSYIPMYIIDEYNLQYISPYTEEKITLRQKADFCDYLLKEHILCNIFSIKEEQTAQEIADELEVELKEFNTLEHVDDIEKSYIEYMEENLDILKDCTY